MQHICYRSEGRAFDGSTGHEASKKRSGLYSSLTVSEGEGPLLILYIIYFDDSEPPLFVPRQNAVQPS